MPMQGIRKLRKTAENSTSVFEMKNSRLILYGPFRQALTMDHLPGKGPMSDEQLTIIENAGILVNGETIEAIGTFRELENHTADVMRIEGDYTVMPGLVDVHTHLCWAGSRAQDYTLRLQGKTYLEIAKQGGGIWSTVTATRRAEIDVLADITVRRAMMLLKQGTTTLEVKSGYGLDTGNELKMLKAVQLASDTAVADLVPTCLAAHMKPKDFAGSPREYLESIVRELLPAVKSGRLSSRVDIYVDEGAFGIPDARYFLAEAKKMGFDLVVHADQFTSGGASLAVEAGARSADHLEAATEQDIQLLAKSPVIAVALPGASLGLGAAFAPARKLLDAGASLAIASDWNPGSAPMGNLLLQSALLGVYERLTMAETLAAVTVRAAGALGMNDRGMLKPGCLADFIAFPCSDYREILYNQGGMKPAMVWKRGDNVENPGYIVIQMP
jgi:imidazolonepropionase